MNEIEPTLAEILIETGAAIAPAGKCWSCIVNTDLWACGSTPEEAARKLYAEFLRTKKSQGAKTK